MKRKYTDQSIQLFIFLLKMNSNSVGAYTSIQKAGLLNLNQVSVSMTYSI